MFFESFADKTRKAKGDKYDALKAENERLKKRVAELERLLADKK